MKSTKILMTGAALAAVTMLGACATAPAGQEMNDPYEATNRAIHGFNKEVDRNVLRPVGMAAASLPEGLRIPVSNFAENTALPGHVINTMLQGDFGGAVQNSMRFLINTTVGVLGLADPASAVGLPAVESDFGATLAYWGAPEGAYLELPLLGPSTERDALGRVVDFVLDPLDGLVIDDKVAGGALETYSTSATLAELAIDRGTYARTIDSVYESADSYAQLRMAYLQSRRYALEQTNQASVFLDPYADAAGAAAAPAASGAYINPYEDFQ